MGKTSMSNGFNLVMFVLAAVLFLISIYFVVFKVFFEAENPNAQTKEPARPPKAIG